MSIVEQWEANFKAMQERDRVAKQHGVLKGRYIKHQYADGYAFYEITRETAKTVRIKVVRDIGDDWELPAWGEECSISRTKAEGFLRQRDGWDALLASRAK